MVFWGNGGPTILENLILLCRFHHRLVHEAGYRVTAHPGQRFTFHRPDGTVIPDTSAGLAGDGDAPARCNAEAGITVTATTTVPDWDGSPPDYDTALLVLAQHRTQGPPPSPPSSNADRPAEGVSAIPPGDPARRHCPAHDEQPW